MNLGTKIFLVFGAVFSGSIIWDKFGRELRNPVSDIQELETLVISELKNASETTTFIIEKINHTVYDIIPELIREANKSGTKLPPIPPIFPHYKPDPSPPPPIHPHPTLKPCYKILGITCQNDFTFLVLMVFGSIVLVKCAVDRSKKEQKIKRVKVSPKIVIQAHQSEIKNSLLEDSVKSDKFVAP